MKVETKDSNVFLSYNKETKDFQVCVRRPQTLRGRLGAIANALRPGPVTDSYSIPTASWDGLTRMLYKARTDWTHGGFGGEIDRVKAAIQRHFPDTYEVTEYAGHDYTVGAPEYIVTIYMKDSLPLYTPPKKSWEEQWKRMNKERLDSLRQLEDELWPEYTDRILKAPHLHIEVECFRNHEDSEEP